KIFSRNTSASPVIKTPVVIASIPSPKSIALADVQTYKVRQGDSLWSISQKFSGVSVEDIKQWNDISGNNLKVGTTLKISK
ncbi:MAG: LysM domain-containing protein, partial [Aquaticitalea sp.]